MAALLSTINVSTTARLGFELLSSTAVKGGAIKSLYRQRGLNLENNRCSKKFSLICFGIRDGTTAPATQRVIGEIKYRKNRKKPIFSEGRDEDEEYGPICPGCGVFMQDKDPTLPGYYQQRKVKIAEFSDDKEDGNGEFEVFLETDADGGAVDEEKESLLISDNEEREVQVDMMELDWDSDELEDGILEEGGHNLDLDGFSLADVGYGNISQEMVEKRQKTKISKSEKRRKAREVANENEEVTVCARCHSLRNYGQVKNQTAENLIPDFDFDRLISTRLMKQPGSGSATVVVMVVDCVDFDGSFPKRAARSLFKAIEETMDDPKASAKLPKLVLVATKVDLLPSQVSPTRLDTWVKHRAKAGGAPKLNAVYLVSSRKDVGIRNLLSFIKKLAGPRGNVWVIGAQNAGKSTLINAFAKKEGAKITKLTEAPLPGTTLGILRIGGVLSAKAKMFDTPGLLHPYLMSMRLNRDEQKMVELRKELRPRSYRIKIGQAIHVGGLVRLDLNEASVQTIYVSIWASQNVSLHLGKIENADDIWDNHVGIRLQPPIDKDRAAVLGKWEAKEVKVSGTKWDENSVDIAIAGLGWFSLCLKGDATLTLWTYDGIETIMREPLVLDRAPFLERPGFWLPNAISDALGKQSKEAHKSKRLAEDDSYLTEVIV